MSNQTPEHIIKQHFNDHFHSLVFHSFRIIQDYNQAEDIVQNVFVKIWQNYEQVKHIGNLKSYLFKATRNSSLNYLRDKKVYDKSKHQVDTSNIEDPMQVEESRREDEMYNKIHHAVDKLPDKWREVFILSKYENMKYYEIAEKMQISIKTVEKYISKALAFLRLELKNIVMLIISLLFIFRKL